MPQVVRQLDEGGVHATENKEGSLRLLSVGTLHLLAQLHELTFVGNRILDCPEIAADVAVKREYLFAVTPTCAPPDSTDVGILRIIREVWYSTEQDG